MDTQAIIRELELLYHGFLKIGDFNRAQETLMEISRLKSTQESTSADGDLLLG